MEVEPSAPGHCDISAGNATIMVQKATIAGLKGFCPRPP